MGLNPTNEVVTIMYYRTHMSKNKEANTFKDLKLMILLICKHKIR